MGAEILCFLPFLPLSCCMGGVGLAASTVAGVAYVNFDSEGKVGFIARPDKSSDEDKDVQ